MPLPVGPCMYTSAYQYSYLTDLVQKLCGIYKAISLWDKKSGSGWHKGYGVNAHTVAKRQVLDEWLKTPDAS